MIRWVSVTIPAREPGLAPVAGEIAECAGCGGRAWVLFEPSGLTHAHVYCLTCGEAHCAAEDCAQRPAPADIDPTR